MMKRYSDIIIHGKPCLFRQGFLFFLLAAITTVFAESKTGLHVKKEGDYYTCTVVCINIKDIKKGSITCAYDSSVNIDKAAVGVLKEFLALGASLDRANRLLHITFSSKGTLTIDSSSLILIKIPALNAGNPPPLLLQSVTMTDKNGSTINPKFVDITSVKRDYRPGKNISVNSDQTGHYLLNGAVVPVKKTGDILDSHKKIVQRQRVYR
ncbi:MAG: hypothetical protein GX640_18500 [Fibrobacter sp.]|nr:hypothetical protein [Fibrobacter sp.]